MSHYGFRKEDGSWFIGMNNKGQFYGTTNPFHPYILKGNLVEAQRTYYLDFPVKKLINEPFKGYEITPIEKLTEDRAHWILEQSTKVVSPAEVVDGITQNPGEVIEKETCLQE